VNEHQECIGLTSRPTLAPFVGLAATLFLAVASAQPYVYPAKGQSQQQIQKDQGDCHNWAQSQAANTVPPPPPQESDTGARGAVGGAAAGAVIAGATGGNGWQGAAAGALIGGIAGTARQNRRNAQNQNNAQAAAQQAYQRAYAACLEGRGYAVK